MKLTVVACEVLVSYHPTVKWECVPAVSVAETGVCEAAEPWYEPE